MHNLVGDFLRRQAERIPDKDCQVFGEKRYTYQYVNVEANRLANALLSSRLSPGDHIGIFSTNCIEYLIAYWGVAKAGMVLVHFNARLKANELFGQIKHADVKVLLFHGELIETVAEVKKILRDVFDLRFVCIGSSPGSWAQAFKTFLEGGEIQEPSELRDLKISEDDPFLMLYTSGTEGFPKGVLMSHRQRISISIQQLLWFMGQRESGYRFLNTMPFFHMVAQTYILTLVILKGTGFQVVPFVPEIFLRTIEREKITSLIFVPTIIKRLLDHPQFSKTDLSSLEIVRYGGEVLNTATRERMLMSFPRVRFSEGLGQTEMGTPVYQLNDDFAVRSESVGRPDPFCDIRIIKENGETAKPREVGEIVVRSPALMLGYYKNQKATKTFFRHGPDWGCTGDIGYVDEEGYVTILSRTKDMYISGGENVYPVEVENVLYEHPAVLEAAVLGLPDEKWGEVGAAAIVLKPGASATENEIFEHCHENLARFKCPKYVKFFLAFPKTASLKVIKEKLKDDFKVLKGN